MNNKTFIWISWGLTLLMMMTCSLSRGDVYMKQKRHTDGMTIMGKEHPSQDVIQEIWITSKGFRTDDQHQSVLMLFDKGKMIILDHREKTYMEMPMDLSMGDIIGEKSESAEEKAAVENMMKGMMKMEVSVNEKGGKKHINGWNCDQYQMDIKTMMGVVSQEIWATQDLKMEYDLYQRFSTAIMGANPMMKSIMNDVAVQMKKIKGVAVRTISSQKIMNQTVTSTTELLEYSNKKAPSGLFDLPKEYKIKSMKEYR